MLADEGAHLGDDRAPVIGQAFEILGGGFRFTGHGDHRTRSDEKAGAFSLKRHLRVGEQVKCVLG